jgi:hypothetical protein
MPQHDGRWHPVIGRRTAATSGGRPPLSDEAGAEEVHLPTGGMGLPCPRPSDPARKPLKALACSSGTKSHAKRSPAGSLTVKFRSAATSDLPRGPRDDPLEHDPAAHTVTAGRTERQHAIADLIAETIIANGVDYGGASSDVVSIHSATVAYQIIDSLRDAGLAMTRRR